MSKFGWSLPAGCTTIPGEDVPDTSPESEEAYELLEKAEVDQAIIDRICEMIDTLALKECPECVRRQNEAEAKFEAEMAEAWKRNERL